MEKVLTKEEMLEEWMARRYGAPVGTACLTITHDHYKELEATAVREMRDWYLQLLDTGEMRYLAPKEIGGMVRLDPTDDNVLEVRLPEGVRRVVEVRLSGWHRCGMIVGPSHPLSLRQGNPYARGYVEQPVVVVCGKTMRIYSPPESAGAGLHLSTLRVIIDEGEDVYRLDDSALGEI